MSSPLHELASEAPAVSAIALPDQVVFPFSNDDSIEAFRDALESRTQTSEYNAARHRVAILIGESALTTNIQRVPEETIVLLDSSGPMVQHMQHYVARLIDSPNTQAWQWSMGIGNTTLLGRTHDRYVRMLQEQLQWWQRNGEPHALTDPDVFQSSQALAQQKAIIPWRGDITSEQDMARLGTALRKYGAVVTMMNLSNVIPYTAGVPGLTSFPDAAGYADRLAHLPITPNAPILTTSSIRSADTMIVKPTGPFYGLGHLREAGGSSTNGPIALRAERRIHDRLPHQREEVNDLVDRLRGLLQRFDLDSF